MKRSQSFIKTRHDAPADELAKNAQLLIRAGYIYKDAAGVYALLPLGLRVVENIKQIVREEMNSLGASELLMTSLQRKEVWQKTDRWDDEKVDVWFKTQLKNGTELGLGWSHEEQIGEMMKSYIASYRDLPSSLYQFQTKLRNETRAKSGIMRAREFIMKDMYSFSASEEQRSNFYDDVIDAYLRVYARLGLGEDTYLTYASGEPFTDFSHEFQTVTEAGEDVIYLHRQKRLAINQEVLNDDVLAKLGLDRADLEEVKASEVGNIFNFGTKKSEQMGLFFSDDNGQQKPVVLWSYGIGITRLMGVMVEHMADEHGLVWPEHIAPYQIYLASLGQDAKVNAAAEELYQTLLDSNLSVIYDDRDVRPGDKFADAELMGIPNRVVVSEKTIAEDKFELKKRAQQSVKFVDKKSLIENLAVSKRS